MTGRFAVGLCVGLCVGLAEVDAAAGTVDALAEEWAAVALGVRVGVTVAAALVGDADTPVWCTEARVGAGLVAGGEDAAHADRLRLSAQVKETPATTDRRITRSR